jgi:ABC-type phosphate transport system permease subunit
VRPLGAAASLVVIGIILMIAFVVVRALPTISHEGLAWLGSGGNTTNQLSAMNNVGAGAPASAYLIRAWPLIYGTALTAGFAIIFGLLISIAASIFIVDFAPPAVRAATTPVIRLLASVPSVLYGLIGILVLVPFVNNNLITQHEKASVAYVIVLNGSGLLVAVVILTVMVTPIMTALITDALESVPRAWREGAIALGLNPLRATIAVSLRATRPAIIAAAGLATARAIGEAIVLSMVSGGVAFAPNPLDGRVFFFEPLSTLAAEIVNNAEGLDEPVLRSTIYAFALLLLFSSFALSLGAYLIKLPLRRYELSR